MKHKGIRKFFRILFIYIPAAFVVLTTLWVLLLKWVPVYFTPLMIQRSIEYANDDKFHTHKTWKPIDYFSPNIVRAAMAAEDNRFMDHFGFDFVEIDNAIDAHKRGHKLRGASTISQQTAKNVFLIPSKSFIRKGFEAYFTVLIEVIWGKKRIMEVYINVAEMGKGVYGAEAAAKQFFNTTGDKLTKRQAALIAACLPHPLVRKANLPGSFVNNRADHIMRVMQYIQYPKKWHKK